MAMPRKRSLSESIDSKHEEKDSALQVDKRSKRRRTDPPSEAIPFLIVFDTEVNGWRDEDENGKPFRHGDPQSRMAQIGWCLYSVNGEHIKSESHYIQPNGWKIAEAQTSEKYGMTQQLVEEKGIPVREALVDFLNDLIEIEQNGGRIAGHKSKYDCTVVTTECTQILTANNINEDDSDQEITDLLNLIENGIGRQYIDTWDLDLLRRLNQCKAFKEDKGESLKWSVRWFWDRTWPPSLGNLYLFVCGGDKIGNAHDARYDAEMCADIIFALKEKFKIDLLE